MRRTLADYRLFVKEFRRTFHTTGAILPSSPMLCRALARYVALPRQGGAEDGPPARRILEVGPGTGSVTHYIARGLRPKDHLDLVELNDRFVARLKERFGREPDFQVVADRTNIIHQMVQELADDEPYDLIISGLPLNNFAVADVEGILKKFRALLKSGGTLSFFQYIAVRPVRSAIGRRAEKQRIRGIGSALDRVLGQHEFRREAIWINVPPAWVHHVRFGVSGRSQSTPS